MNSRTPKREDFVGVTGFLVRGLLPMPNREIIVSGQGTKKSGIRNAPLQRFSETLWV
jgi:hypothetical protein